MSDILTVSLLSLLSKAEMTAFGKYLQSPFFTNKKFLHPLFSVLRKPGAQAAVAAETTFLRVFPGETFDRHKWNKALSDLNRHIAEFITIRHFLDTPDLFHQARIAAFFDKTNQPYFRSAVSAVLGFVPGKDVAEKTDAWWLQYWSRKRAITYPLTNRMKLPADTLDILEDNLDILYHISKLQLACNRISSAFLLKNTSQRNNNRHLLEMARPIAAAGKSPLLNLYYHLLSLLLNEGVDFDTFFAALQTHGKHLDRGELEAIVRFGFNHCIMCHRQGETRALGWHIQLYDWSSGQGVWTAEVAEDLFLNMGILFSKTNKLAEFENLLKSGKKNLSPERQKHAESLLLAYRHFYQGNYVEAQKNIAFVASRHPRYTMMRHSLAVRNAYMLWLNGQFDPEHFELALDRFSDFLKRQDLYANVFINAYQQLIWLIRKLAQVGQERNATKSSLRKEINRRQPAGHDWLEAMIDKLPIRE